ncbi:helix-turn-helix domain-containing protein [Serratia fonticola]|uniref:helix-turn-helix domain-containing protein n=1 Tax=Serratia fonticola TaxID=47917 RepID=UPI00164564A6|nr:helix-turn-helix transcriptional regulator [Serratia fonticola]MBC3228321.1 helix-turn-helix transcriptional regulator [Serratia fonticola]
MKNEKESDFAFPTDGKESIQDRFKALFRGRTLRRVAQEWGLPYSTLNNYFSKGATPGLDVVIKVSEIEHVSIEWLILGSGSTLPQRELDAQHRLPLPMKNEPLKSAWLTAFEYLDEEEVKALLRIIHKLGAKGIISSVQHEMELEEMLMLLPIEEKERLMALHEAKKGASEGSQENELIRPTHKAG